MTVYEQYSEQNNLRWQKRIISTGFICSVIIAIFEIVYYFIITAANLRDQTTLEYVLKFILLPATTIFLVCFLGRYVVYHSKLNTDIKSLASLLTMVAICCTAATVHNIFAAILSSYFVPISLSIVYGKKSITNKVGIYCVLAQFISMFAASQDFRGQNPYFLLDSLMFFIAFGFVWYTTLILMTNEQEKRHVMDNMRKEQSMLEQKICHDQLTGLYNLLGVQLFVQEKSADSYAYYSGSSIAFLDVDDFKTVNDHYGHEVGNITLISLANIFKENFPKDCCIARYGGDEFVVLLPNISCDDCKSILDDLLYQVCNYQFKGMAGRILSLSCGICSYNFCDPVLEAITSSDKAMYTAKTAGKNLAVIFKQPE